MAKPDRARFAFVPIGSTTEEQIELAVLADRLGFDAIITGEHIVLPAGAPSVYMPHESSDITKAVGLPRSIYDETSRFPDQVALMAVIAYETRHIALITGVYLAGLRHPLMTAGSIATLSELSRGRFQLGLGVGWNRGEYEALGGNFDERGSVMDETIDVLKAAMRGGAIEYHGRHHSFDPVRLTQRPFSVPLLFGGHSAPALRRTARVGDGWISSLSNDPNELVQLARRLDALRVELGTAERPFDHWIKLTTIDPTVIEGLRRSGIEGFQLIGDQVWGPKDASLQARMQRMREVAAALNLEPHS